MQQKMMKYMMVFMGLVFFKLASGLCIYFIASESVGTRRAALPAEAHAGGQHCHGNPRSGEGPGERGRQGEEVGN